MPYDKSHTVQFTGCPANSLLEGAFDSNQGMLIRVIEEQPPSPNYAGKINGRFELLKAGNGKYSGFLTKLEGQEFSANELVRKVMTLGGEKCTYIVHCDMLIYKK